MPVPTKGASEHTGLVPTQALRDRALQVSVQNTRSESLYKETHRLQPGDVRPRDKTGGGYWIPGFSRVDPSLSLKGKKSTYQSELEDSGNTAQGALSKTNGLTITVAK